MLQIFTFALLCLSSFVLHGNGQLDPTFGQRGTKILNFDGLADFQHGIILEGPEKFLTFGWLGI